MSLWLHRTTFNVRQLLHDFRLLNGYRTQWKISYQFSDFVNELVYLKAE